jgi:hypothetical protein
VHRTPPRRPAYTVLNLAPVSACTGHSCFERNRVRGVASLSGSTPPALATHSCESPAGSAAQQAPHTSRAGAQPEPSPRWSCRPSGAPCGALPSTRVQLASDRAQAGRAAPESPTTRRVQGRAAGQGRGAGARPQQRVAQRTTVGPMDRRQPPPGGTRAVVVCTNQLPASAIFFFTNHDAYLLLELAK